MRRCACSKKRQRQALDLTGVDAVVPAAPCIDKQASSQRDCSNSASLAPSQAARVATPTVGQSLTVPISALDEDTSNPRTEFPEAELDELAADIRQHGISQAIVVHPADTASRYCIHFGAKRLRAAQRAGLQVVPIVVRDASADPNTKVTENQKRHGLTPLDPARFIQGRVDAGDSNTTVAKRLGMNLTTVAHHLALLGLPPELDRAMKSGRCISPRTLHELRKLHDEQPEQVRAVVTGDAEITRASVSAMRAAPAGSTAVAPSSAVTLIAQANAVCDRLERVLQCIDLPVTEELASDDLIDLRVRVADLANRWLQGSAVRPLCRPVTDSLEPVVNRAVKDRWQVRRRASERMPHCLLCAVGHGERRA